jgi:hypothetical protein
MADRLRTNFPWRNGWQSHGYDPLGRPTSLTCGKGEAGAVAVRRTGG